MADLRQQAPQIQPQLRDTRLYSRVAPEGNIGDAIAAGVGALAQSFDGNARGRRAAEAAAADANQARVANDTALSLFNENVEFVDTNSTRLEQSLAAGAADEQNLAALSGAERSIRLLSLAEGQGRGDSFTRARALQSLNMSISRDPGNAAVYMASYKELTGNTYFDDVVAARQEAQALEISASENAVSEYNRLVSENGWRPGTPPEVVFQHAEDMGAIGRNLATLQKSLEATQATKGIDAATQQKYLNNIGTELNNTTSFGVQRVLQQFPDPAAMTPEGRTAAINQVYDVLNETLNGVVSRFDALDLTAQQLLDRNPSIQAQVDLAVGYLNGSVARDMAQADLDYHKKVPQIARMRDPTFARLYGDMAFLNDIDAPWISAEMTSKLRGQGGVILDQMIPLFDNTLTTPDPDAQRTGQENPTPGASQGSNEAPVPTTSGFGISIGSGTGGRRYITERGVTLRNPSSDMSGALSYVGLMLSDEGMANIGEQSGAALGAMSRLANSMNRNADNIPVDYYRQFANFTASEDGMRAFANASEMDDEIFDGFIVGYNEYLSRTAAAMAEDLRDDTVEGFQANVRVTRSGPESLMSDTTTYSILEDGSIVFKPRPEFSTHADVNRKVRKLNNKYSSVLRDQVKSYAHIINKNEDYITAFEDLFTSGEFAINNQDEVLLTRFRREYPEYADRSDEELQAVLGTGGR